MNDRIKNFGRIIAQGILSVVAFGIVLLALLQIALMLGFATFNTGKGRALVEDQLKAMLADRGYDISIGTLFYDPVRGINVYDVALADKTGTFATLDRISVGVAFEKLLLRELELFATGGTLAIARFPQSDSEDPDTSSSSPLQPFTLPDIYFRLVAIDYFTMKSIVLPAADPAHIKSISPTLRANVLLGDDIGADISLVTRPSPALQAMQVPEKISVSGTFTPSSLNAQLSKLEILADAYKIEGSGQGSLAENNAQDFQINAEHTDLSPLTADNLQSAAANITVTGTSAAPVLTINGTLTPAKLSERGLGDIALQATATGLTQSPRLDVSLKTLYGEDDISVNTILVYTAPGIVIETFGATAPHAELSGTGNYNLDTALADIKLDINVDQLAHYSALMGVDLSGSIDATVAAMPQDGKQALNVSASINGAKYETITAREINADLSFPDILAAYWPQDADIKISSLKLADDMSVTAATIALKQADAGAYLLSLNGNGSIGKPFTLKGSSRIESFSTPLPTLRDISLALGLGRSSVALKGALDPEKIDLSMTTKDFHARDLPASIPVKMRRVDIDGDIRMTGSPAAPVTTADIDITGLNTGQYEGLRLTLDATHENGQLQATMSGNGTGIRTLEAETSLPLTFALSPFAFSFDSNAAINGKIVADIDLAPIASIFLQPTQLVTGTLDASGAIGGTVATPSINGNASIDKASFLDEQNGIELAGIIAKARFTQDSVNITTLQATDGENGTLNGSGNISFAETGTDLSLAMTNFHLPKGQTANGYINADLSLRDAGTAYEATGAIDIQSMDVLIPETFQSKIPELNIVERGKEDEENAAKSLLLDIDVTAENQFFVRGWGLDAEFGGAIEISGSADEPMFEGAFKARRGRYEEFGKRFELARADLRFQGTIPPSPYLDIEATTNAEDVVASVLLTGPVQNPGIAFSSVPSLPEDEVLARILFGKSTTRISAFQAIQLTQTIARFSGQGGSGLDPMGMIRGVTGLDDISVETDSAGETTVGAGKYLTDKVYLEFEGGGGENSGGANLQIEVSPNVTIESEIGQDAQGGGGIFWKRDY